MLPSVRHGENEITDLVLCSTVCEMCKSVYEGVASLESEPFRSCPFVLDKVCENLIS